MHCTIMHFAYVWLISPIGHVCAELELEVPTEQVQVKDFTNLVLTQGKKLDDNLVVLGATFRITLVDPISMEHR
jgi:hypothetical protein